MENYTFFKFIKIKEKEIKKEIKYLKTQYGGTNTINLNHIQLKLLKLQNQLKSIKNKSPDTLINPYNKLKIQIDEINNSIKQLQKVNTLPTDNTEILNKITELQIVLDSTPNDYNKIQANTKVAYVGEAINSEQITMIFNKYANDSNMMISDIKKNLKENSNQLISNKEINKTIKQIQTKIDEYTINLTQFIELEQELNENIKKMEEIFTVEIDKDTLCVNPEKNDIIINVDKISKEKTQELELNIDVDTEPSKLIGTDFLKVNNKYYKKFSEKSIDKNIINLHNEWLELVKNYKNKLENEIIKDKKNILTGGADSDDDSDDDDGDDKEEEIESKKSIFDLINKLNEYEVLVRKIKNHNIKIIKLVKLYNIRYSQFFNFQKYIVNYVSLRISEGGYSYYQYMSKGSISFFDSLLTDLNNILKKFNNYSSLNDDDLQFLNKEHIKWFYAKHYFMITILQNFFSKLYIFWSQKQEQELTKNLWTLDKQIRTDAYNSKYFFLFNIFQEILMEYYMRLPSIANYIRINKIKEDDKMVVTFEKENKHNLKESSLSKCSLQGNVNTTQAKDISQIKFAEIFDPENFKENDSIPYYMGLSDSLNKGKSILILTYGYSGVGKSYTLFGSSKKEQTVGPNREIILGTDGPIPGMLQSTLKSLGSGIKIKVKMFELYGLGVPYKFYWEDTSNFCHFIYAYRFDAENNITYNKIDKDGFTNYLDINDDYNYQELDKTNIDDFTNFIKKIDDIRKQEGRIKSTLNNPESSRSIMIYDFKIELKNTEKTGKKFTNFVVRLTLKKY